LYHFNSSFILSIQYASNISSASIDNIQSQVAYFNASFLAAEKSSIHAKEYTLSVYSFAISIVLS